MIRRFTLSNYILIAIVFLLQITCQFSASRGMVKTSSSSVPIGIIVLIAVKVPKCDGHVPGRHWDADLLSADLVTVDSVIVSHKSEHNH